MTKTNRYKGLVMGSFLVPEIDLIFGNGVGASLVGLTFCPKSNQEKILIACQVEPNAEQRLVIWIQSCKTLEYVFPRQTVQNCNTVIELQNLSVVNSIDFRKQNGCHRISDEIDVISLTVELANDSLVDIELVEKSIQPKKSALSVTQSASPLYPKTK